MSDEHIKASQCWSCWRLSKLCFDRTTKRIATPVPQTRRQEQRQESSDRETDRQTVIPRDAIKRLADRRGGWNRIGQRMSVPPEKNYQEWINRSWLEDTHRQNTKHRGASELIRIRQYKWWEVGSWPIWRQTWGHIRAQVSHPVLQLGAQRDDIYLVKASSF